MPFMDVHKECVDGVYFFLCVCDLFIHSVCLSISLIIVCN